ncbi:MAG: DUF3137 domain-containing protein [Roseibacillus sp.]
MRTTDEILENLQPTLERCEKERLTLLAKRKTGGLWIAGISLGGFILALSFAQQSLVFTIAILTLTVVILVVCHSIFFGSTNATYRHLFKSKVVAHVAESMAPGITFQPNHFISKDWFQRSGLFRKPDRYKGEDYFVGKIGKTELFFSEVHAEQEHTSTDSDGDTSTHYTTIFKGIFLVADFHKDFRTQLSVTPDKLESFGFLGKKLQNLGGKVQRMENVDFERLFVVRSADPIEARYILTPAMQERFVELTRTWGPQLNASFQDSLIYLALPMKNDWFEGRISTPIGDPDQFHNLVAQLHACFSTVEDLDLNTRIWTKE